MGHRLQGLIAACRADVQFDPHQTGAGLGHNALVHAPVTLRVGDVKGALPCDQRRGLQLKFTQVIVGQPGGQ